MLLFTDGDGRVVLIHHQATMLTRSQRAQAAIEVESIPSAPVVEEGASLQPVLRVHDGDAVWTLEPAPPSRDSVERASQRVLGLVAGIVAGLDAETLAEIESVFPSWSPWVQVEAGDVRRWDGGLVECIQPHTTQPDWTPDVTPALWKVHRTDTGGTVEWEAGLVLTTDDQVIHDGIVYDVIQAHTTQEGWEPPNTPALFEPV